MPTTNPNKTKRLPKLCEALLDNADKQAASIAYTQLGIMQAKDKELEKAAELFKQALKKDPKNDNARYNYELVKKMLQKQQQEQDQQDKIEPSEFAKQQKAIADDLVNKRDYRVALQVMIEAYQRIKQYRPIRTLYSDSQK